MKLQSCKWCGKPRVAMGECLKCRQLRGWIEAHISIAAKMIEARGFKVVPCLPDTRSPADREYDNWRYLERGP